jgi:acyl-CoA reductase-like NAD-dependent aldehyde dehydrogenase
LNGGKSSMVVFDSADLDSAVEGVVDAAWFNQGQVVYCIISDYRLLELNSHLG